MSFKVQDILIPCFPKRTNFKLNPEDMICAELFSNLTAIALDDRLNGIFFHVPNEISNNKNPVYGMKQKMIGKINGVADYIFINGESSLCLEIKTEKGRLSETQKLFQQWCESYNVPYKVARSFKEAIKIIKDFGFIKKEEENE